MVKKLLLASAIMLSTTGIALANPAPYVGAGIGINTNTSNNPTNYRGVPFNVFAGYGGIISQTVYLAGEVGATLGTADLSNQNGLKTSYGYSASVLPGVMLNDSTMAYGRLGVVRTHFTSPGSTQTGGVIGFGLQTSVTQNVDFRGEYNYKGYRSFNNNTFCSPRTDAFNFDLVYKFD